MPAANSTVNRPETRQTTGLPRYLPLEVNGIGDGPSGQLATSILFCLPPLVVRIEADVANGDGVTARVREQGRLAACCLCTASPRTHQRVHRLRPATPPNRHTHTQVHACAPERHASREQPGRKRLSQLVGIAQVAQGAVAQGVVPAGDQEGKRPGLTNKAAGGRMGRHDEGGPALA